MTPAIKIAKRAKISFQAHEYLHQQSCTDYGAEVALNLAVDGHRIFKTIVVNLDNHQLAVAVLPVPEMLSLKSFAKVVGVKKAKLAEPAEVERATGYVLGGVSPLGQKKCLVTVIDTSASAFDTIYVSGGKRGLEIELAPQDLIQLVKGSLAPITL